MIGVRISPGSLFGPTRAGYKRPRMNKYLIPGNIYRSRYPICELVARAMPPSVVHRLSSRLPPSDPLVLFFPLDVSLESSVASYASFPLLPVRSVEVGATDENDKKGVVDQASKRSTGHQPAPTRIRPAILSHVIDEMILLVINYRLARFGWFRPARVLDDIRMRFGLFLQGLSNTVHRKDLASTVSLQA